MRPSEPHSRHSLLGLLDCACSGKELTISIVCKSIGNISVCIGDGNGTASAVEVIGLERAVYFLTDKSLNQCGKTI